MGQATESWMIKLSLGISNPSAVGAEHRKPGDIVQQKFTLSVLDVRSLKSKVLAGLCSQGVCLVIFTWLLELPAVS